MRCLWEQRKAFWQKKKCAKYTCGSVIELTSRWPSCAILIFILFFFLLLILQCSSVSYAFFHHSSVQFAISYKNVYLICKNQKTTKNYLKECRSLFVKKKKKSHVLQLCSAGEVCEAIHHLPFSFFPLSLPHQPALFAVCMLLGDVIFVTCIPVMPHAATLCNLRA